MLVFGGLAYGLRRLLGRRRWLWGVLYFLIAFVIENLSAIVTYVFSASR